MVAHFETIDKALGGAGTASAPSPAVAAPAAPVAPATPAAAPAAPAAPTAPVASKPTKAPAAPPPHLLLRKLIPWNLLKTRLSPAWPRQGGRHDHGRVADRPHRYDCSRGPR